ncbi:MAG: hypothetical protein HY791_17705 [Deltaproteobacteria bacterium]|nr:hypothetical protein [Deltaproteobacteria bacterium]
MTSAERVSAPGKLFLFGEYGVLGEGRAIVAAVDRRAVGFRTSHQNASPVVRATLRRADEDFGLDIDTSAFWAPGSPRRKLGLGSSAAVAVVTAALAKGVSRESLSIALAGHRDAQEGRGSGLDVLVSHVGGVIAAGRPAEPDFDDPEFERMELSPPIGLFVSVVYMGQSALTSELVRAARAGGSFPRIAEKLADVAERAISSWRGGRVTELLDLVNQHHALLEELTRESGAPIVTPALHELARLAQSRGAAAKPSGAGGGDIATIWSGESSIGQELARELHLEIVPLAIEPIGVRIELEGSR